MTRQASAATATEPPLQLRPHGGCVRALPSRCCPKRNYYAKPNAELFDRLNFTTHEEVEDAVCGTIDLIAVGLDLAASEASVYTPTTSTSKATCFATAAEAVCEFAFPRCTPTCDALVPCLEVCDNVCGEHLALLPLVEGMLAAPGTPYRSVALAGTAQAVHSCRDLTLANGEVWTPNARVLGNWGSRFYNSFTLSTPCSLPEVTDTPLLGGSNSIKCDSEVLGVDGVTSMTAACCSCGGGERKAYNRSAAEGASLQLAVDFIASKFAVTCTERTPAGMEPVPSCVVMEDDNLVYHWASDDTLVTDVSGTVELSVQGAASLRACALVCSTRTNPRCLGITFTPSGCLLWFDEACWSGESENSGGIVEQGAAATYRRCEIGSCKDSSANNEGLSLAINVPCSSSAPATALTTFDETEAPCRDQYRDVHAKQLRGFTDELEAAARAEAAALAENARADAAVAETKAVEMGFLAGLILLTPTTVVCFAVAHCLWRGGAAVAPTAVGRAVLTPPTWRLLGHFGFALIALFIAQAALMMFAGLHEGSGSVHKVTYAALQTLNTAVPMVILFRAPEIARQSAAKRRGENEEGGGCYARLKQKMQPFSFGGKYFVRVLLVVEAIEVCSRTASIVAGAAEQSNLLTSFVTSILGVNLVVTPLLVWRKLILHLMFFDIGIDAALLLCDLFAMSNSPEAQGMAQLAGSAIACLSVTKTLFQLAVEVVERNEAALAAVVDEAKESAGSAPVVDAAASSAGSNEGLVSTLAASTATQTRNKRRSSMLEDVRAKLDAGLIAAADEGTAAPVGTGRHRIRRRRADAPRTPAWRPSASICSRLRCVWICHLLRPLRAHRGAGDRVQGRGWRNGVGGRAFPDLLQRQGLLCPARVPLGQGDAPRYS